MSGTARTEGRTAAQRDASGERAAACAPRFMVRVKLRSGKLWSFWGQSGCDTECGTLVTHADARAIVDRLPQMFEGVVIGPLEGRDG